MPPAPQTYISTRSGFSLLQLSQRAAAAVATRTARPTTPYAGSHSPCCFLSGTSLLQQQPRCGGNKLDTATAAATAVPISSCGERRTTVSPWVRRSSRGATTAILTAALLSSSPRGTSAGAGAGAAAAAGSSSSSGPPGWSGRRARSYHAPSVTVSGTAAAAAAGGGVGGVAPAVEGGLSPVVEPRQGGKSPVIFVLGGPGSGKGTQCDRLAKEYGWGPGLGCVCCVCCVVCGVDACLTTSLVRPASFFGRFLLLPSFGPLFIPVSGRVLSPSEKHGERAE